MANFDETLVESADDHKWAQGASASVKIITKTIGRKGAGDGVGRAIDHGRRRMARADRQHHGSGRGGRQQRQPAQAR